MLKATNALEINNLCKVYRDGTQALNSISFQVASGDFCALLGPNGAGKSTTIGIISSLLKKTSGHVSVFGYDIETDNNLAKQQIGLVPQEFNCNIFNTCTQIITDQAGYYGVAKKIAKERSRYFLDKVGLYKQRNQIARNLSGGMKRRLLIARALAHQPKLLILDEPTAGVDVKLRHFMWHFLQELNQQGTTIILTTHYLEEAEALCRNIVIINDGNVIENTDKATLLAKLHQKTYIFECQNSLKQLPVIPSLTIQAIDTHNLQVQIPHHYSFSQVIKSFSELDIEILNVRLKTNPLEELFLNLTNPNKEHPNGSVDSI